MTAYTEKQYVEEMIATRRKKAGRNSKPPGWSQSGFVL